MSKALNFGCQFGKSGVKSKELQMKLGKYKPAECDIWLKQFYAEMKNEQGKGYESQSLRVMVLLLSNGFKVRPSLEPFSQVFLLLENVKIIEKIILLS